MTGYWFNDLEKVSFSSGKSVFTGKNSIKDTWSLLQDYREHQHNCEQGSVTLHGISKTTGKKHEKKLPVIYRTHPIYKKAILARIYRLDGWYQNLPREQKFTSMLTLTTKQTGLTYFDQYQSLKESWKKISQLIKKQHPTAEYLAIWEPHKTGYAHIHVIYFGVKFKDAYSNKLASLWSEKYGIAGLEGLKIDCKKTGSLKSARNYVMKYVTKGLTTHGIDTKQDTYPDSINKKQDTNYGIQFEIFNAVLWEMSRHCSDYEGVRSFQPSRTLSRVMCNNFDSDPDIVWYSANYHYGGEVYSIFDKSGEVYQRLKEDFDKLIASGLSF